MVPQHVPRQRQLQSNTWGPTTAVLKVEDRTHPSTTDLPATFTSAVSEWYSWSNDLRQNPDIKILASVDPSSFPSGTDPNQSWYSGYYPILWTNRSTGCCTRTSATTPWTTPRTPGCRRRSRARRRTASCSTGSCGSAARTARPAAGGPISETAWYSLQRRNGTCVDARSAATANGTAIQQYTCNGTNAQQYQFQPTDGGYVRINDPRQPQQVIDVTNVSTADNAPLQLWTYGGGRTSSGSRCGGSGSYHFIAGTAASA